MNWIERAHAALGKLLVIRRLNRLEQRVAELETALMKLKQRSKQPWCPRCGRENVKPGISHVKDGRVVHLCRCPNCRYEFPFID